MLTVTIQVRRLGYAPTHYADVVASTVAPATHWGAPCVVVADPVVALCGARLRGSLIATSSRHLESHRQGKLICRACAIAFELGGKELDQSRVDECFELAATLNGPRTS